MITSETVFTSKRFQVDEVTRALSDGTVQTKAIVRHPGAVTIIPMVDDDHVCLINNYRVSVDQVLIELPAGTLEAAHTPLEMACRELQEETGYTAGSLTELTWFFLSPGILDEKMHVFVARDLTPGPPAREAGEEIENGITPWGDAIAMIFSGQITDAKTIAALLIYDRVRQQSPNV